MKTDNGKRKIIKGRNFPNSEQINARQNFDRIQKGHSATMQNLAVKKVITWAGAVACVAGVAGAVYLNRGKDMPLNVQAKEKTMQAREICIQPPILGKKTPYTFYRISTKTGGIINYPTGSSLAIPANAFKNPNGTAVSDSVDIRYREFHKPLDIFLSGIPMKYDSAGVVRTLETAGMLEIRALDKGQQLVLNDQTSIDIRMASSSNDPMFNLYELDTTSKNWIFKGKDKIEEPKPQNSTARSEPKKETSVVINNTLKPTMADPKKFSFKIKYEKDEFPELAAYDDVLFEVADNNFKPAFYKINWRKISLHCGDIKGSYVVKLIKADTTISVNARPVFDKENYEAALQKFEERHAIAKTEQEKKDLETQKKLDNVNKELSSYNPRDLVTAAFGMAGMTTSFRRFSVRSLGFHNIDLPIPAVAAYAYKILSRSNNGRSTQYTPAPTFTTIFLLEKGKNTLFRFSRGEPVRCNPDVKNLMWTINNNNQIAFFRITDYRKLINGGENNIDPVVAPDQDQALDEIKEFSM